MRKKEGNILFFSIAILILSISFVYASCGDKVCDSATESWYEDSIFGKTECLDDCLPPPEACCKFSCSDLTTEDINYFCQDNGNIGEIEELDEWEFWDLLPSGYTYDEEEYGQNLNHNGFVSGCFCGGATGSGYMLGKGVCNVEEQGIGVCDNYYFNPVNHSGKFNETTSEFKNAGCNASRILATGYYGRTIYEDTLVCSYQSYTDYFLDGGFMFSDCADDEHCRYEPTQSYYEKLWKFQVEKEKCDNTGEGCDSLVFPEYDLINEAVECEYYKDVPVGEGDTVTGFCSQEAENCNMKPSFNLNFSKYDLDYLDPLSEGYYFGDSPSVVFSNCYESCENPSKSTQLKVKELFLKEELISYQSNLIYKSEVASCPSRVKFTEDIFDDKEIINSFAHKFYIEIPEGLEEETLKGWWAFEYDPTKDPNSGQYKPDWSKAGGIWTWAANLGEVINDEAKNAPKWLKCLGALGYGVGTIGSGNELKFKPIDKKWGHLEVSAKPEGKLLDISGGRVNFEFGIKF
jgi:hypothetical protein